MFRIIESMTNLLIIKSTKRRKKTQNGKNEDVVGLVRLLTLHLCSHIPQPQPLLSLHLFGTLCEHLLAVIRRVDDLAITCFMLTGQVEVHPGCAKMLTNWPHAAATSAKFAKQQQSGNRRDNLR